MKSKFNIPTFINFLKMYSQWFFILFWALWIGRAMLDLGLDSLPSGGRDYIQSMQNQYIWTLLPKCGVCFFWNGFTNGGAPAFIDILAGWLHPITVVATFLYGVFNSGKVIVIASLVMAGIAQWWLGKVFNLSLVSRMWTALLFVSSGALAGRMEAGSATLVLSTAACTLVIPPAINLTREANTKNTIVLGIVLGLAAISGQGYIQVGLLFCLPPMVLIMLLETSPEKLIYIKTNWRHFAFAILLAALIAAPLLLPLAHISSVFGKDTDMSFNSSQPFKYTLLNLVINESDFYMNEVLGKKPYPFRYINYIGWIPVLLALWGVAHVPKPSKKLVTSVCITIGFILFFSSSEMFKWLSLLVGEKLIAGLRNPGVVQSLAVPLILILAGLGVDHILNQKWPKLSLTLLPPDHALVMLNADSIKWLLLLAVLGLSLKSTSEFSKRWIYAENPPNNSYVLIDALVTKDAQWVQPPFGEYSWLPAAVEHGMKIKDYYRPWRIGTAALPKAHLEMSRSNEDLNLPEYKETVGGFIILHRPESLYAYTTAGPITQACQATSIGGIIDVQCDNSAAGVLTVMERAWSGWYAWVDGQPQALLNNPWLSVNTATGKHVYSFRYLPWDAPVGLGLALLGWLIAYIGFFNPANLYSRAVLRYGKRASDRAETDAGT